MKPEKIAILGGGLAGLSAAYFIEKKNTLYDIDIIEKNETLGGLCRTMKKDGYEYDIGPHIIFSKDEEMLKLMWDFLGQNRNELVRSNQIIYKQTLIQYPFENDLSKLPENDLKYCIDSFNNNPYEDYEALNMIQFFLKTFGEGITNLYLRPYNEKIWKYDPVFMNTDMVERIPKPTKDEIRRSAAGETVQGYLHQLYFSYPSYGGIQTLTDRIAERLDRCRIECGARIIQIRKLEDGYIVNTKNREYFANHIISTIPVPELIEMYVDAPSEVLNAASQLRYNSIIISFVRLPYDLSGNNFAFTIPDKDVIFHRISKMDFLGRNYHKHIDESTYIVEITYREGDIIAGMEREVIERKISDGFLKIGFAKNLSDCEFIDFYKEKYAYVVYDVNHKKNMNIIREFFQEQGIKLHGRFGNFEYWNMDRVLRESFHIAQDNY